MSPSIECQRLSTGKWLISAGQHCAEVDDDDKLIDAAITRLAADSGVPRVKIAVAFTRRQLADV